MVNQKLELIPGYYITNNTGNYDKYNSAIYLGNDLISQPYLENYKNISKLSSKEIKILPIDSSNYLDYIHFLKLGKIDDIFKKQSYYDDVFKNIKAHKLFIENVDIYNKITESVNIYDNFKSLQGRQKIYRGTFATDTFNSYIYLGKYNINKSLYGFKNNIDVWYQIPRLYDRKFRMIEDDLDYYQIGNMDVFWNCLSEIKFMENVFLFVNNDTFLNNLVQLDILKDVNYNKIKVSTDMGCKNSLLFKHSNGLSMMTSNISIYSYENDNIDLVELNPSLFSNGLELNLR